MIKINEKSIPFQDGISVFNLKLKYKKNADVIIYNGYPITKDQKVKDGDQIVLIKKGEIPNPNELQACLVSRHSPGVYEKVKKSIIGIAGIGGLGSTVATGLVRLGVGKLIIVDYDIVEPSNLNRQQYYVNQIGEYKVNALKKNLKEINPYVQVESHIKKISRTNISQLFEKVNILVEGFDKADQKAMLFDEFITCYPKKWIIMASGLSGYESGNEIKVKKFGKRGYIVGDRKSEAQIGMGLMSPRVGIAANQQSNQVLEIIIKDYQET